MMITTTLLTLLQKHPRWKNEYPYSVAVKGPKTVDDPPEIKVSVRWTWEDDSFEDFIISLQRDGRWGVR